jgi:fructokinase
MASRSAVPVSDASARSVLAAGYVALDIIRFRGKIRHAAGGTAGNVAAILGFLGWDAAVAADLGNDLAGHRVRRDLRAANVDTSWVTLQPGRDTPRVVHSVDEGLHSYSFICPACRTRLPRSRPLRIQQAHAISESRAPAGIFFFDRANAGTVTLAEEMASQGAFVVFEPSMRGDSELMWRALAVADLVKHASDRDVGDSAASPLSRQIQIVTQGAEGARYRVGRSNWRESPAFPYPTIDAGGAGDWTTAGLLHALGTERSRSLGSVSNALRWGQALAAVSCSAPGARGLAQQHNAQSVVREVQFLQTSAEASAPSVDPRPIVSKRRDPKGRCSVCLLSIGSRFVGHRAQTLREAAE